MYCAASMKNKRTFRAPFVMTLAAGAMAATVSGCGGDVVTGVGPGCPTEIATVGAACDPAVSTEVCNYGTAFPGCPGTYPNSRVCNPTTRQWMSVTATCNPPPPMCPTTPPMQGAACVGDLSCSFDGCAHNGVWSARCSGGRWDLQRGSCNPPPPACPPTAPSDGQPCQPGFGIAVCPYGPPGCGMGSAVFTCGGDSSLQWRRRPVRCDTNPGCPAYAPDANTFCTPAPTTQYCVYASTNPCDPSHRALRCDDTGRWTPAISSCNPPPPFCPEALPQEGAACDRSRSPLPCSYGDCGGRPVAEATCVNNRWVTRLGECDQDGGTEPGDGGTEPSEDGGTEPGDAGPPEDADIFVDAG